MTSLAITAVRSLNDSIGSVADYLNLVGELNTFENTLKVIDERIGLQRQQNQVMAARIDDVTRQCRLEMDKFRNNVRSYQKAFLDVDPAAGRTRFCGQYGRRMR